MSSPTPPTKNKPKELSNELRMLLAFVLMGAILLVTPYVYRKLGLTPPTTEKKAQTAVKTQSAKPSEPPAAATAGGAPIAPSAPPEAAPAVPTVSAPGEQDQVIDTGLYHVVFTNRGAVVKSWTLKKFKDNAGMPLELVNQKGDARVGHPFEFAFREKQPSPDLNSVLWAAHATADTVKFEYADGRTHAVKTFAFQPDGYMVQYADDVTLDGAGLPHLVEWRGGFGDMAVQNAAGQQGTIRFDVQKNKLVRDGAKSAKNGPVNTDGDFSFAGIDDQYFAAAFLPPANTAVQMTTYDDVVSSSVNSSDEPYPGVAVGGSARNQFGVYVGPKEIALLHQVNPKLDGIVDWGWFGIFAKPLFMVLHYLNDALTHNYGWAIILLTVIINVALFPLKLSSLKSSRKMQALQPEMKRITDKYKGVGMSDPKAANKQQEIMDLYKKHGVNPMGGCIPLLIQMPFIYAFYKVLAVSIELRHAPWLWVPDLSQHERFEIHFLPLIMTVTSFFLQKMTPPPAAGDPSQQKMMQLMPLMYLFIFWSLSSGVVLYWLTGNLVGMAQQWFFNKTAGPVEIVAATKKDGRKRA